MTHTEEFIADMVDAAERLGIAPSTLGERIGQGGHFYKRLCEGKRVWPETLEESRKRIAGLIAASACEVSHNDDGAEIQGGVK